MVETIIKFVTTYNDVIVAVLGSLVLILAAFAVYFTYFMQAETPEVKAETDLQGIEESLKKLIMEVNQGGFQGTRVGAVAAEQMGIPIPGTGKYGKVDPDTGNLLDEEGNVVLDEDGNPIPASTIEGAEEAIAAQKAAAAAEAAGSPAGGAASANADPAQVAALKKELDSKKAELTQMKEKLEGGDLNNTDELLAKLKVLQDRLAEYEIIEDDIADLSIYKEENIRLKEELEAYKSGDAPKPEPAKEAASAEEAPKQEAPAEEVAEEAPAEAESSEAAPAAEPTEDELHAEFDEAAKKLDQEAELSTEGSEGEQTADLSTEGGEGEQTADLSTEGSEGEQTADLSTEGNEGEQVAELSTDGDAPAEQEVADEPAVEAPPAPEMKVDETPESKESLGSIEIKESGDKPAEKSSGDIFAEFSGGDDGGDPLGDFDPDKMLKELHGIDATGADASVVQDDADMDKMAKEAKKL